MKISKGTIVRTALLAILIINIVLKKLGLNIINTDENTILSIVDTIIQIGIIISAWWYNNSFSEKALKAQQFFNKLKGEDLNV